MIKRGLKREMASKREVDEIPAKVCVLCAFKRHPFAQNLSIGKGLKYSAFPIFKILLFFSGYTMWSAAKLISTNSNEKISPKVNYLSSSKLYEYTKNNLIKSNMYIIFYIYL